MAYIKDQDQDQQQPGMNILSPTQTAPAPAETGIQPVGPSTPTPTMAQPGQAAAPSTKPKKGVGSGTFTNIRRYIEANKPATQQMTQQVAGKVEQQAGQIGQSLQQKQQAYQQQLEQNKQNVQQAQQFGTQMLQQAGQQQAGGQYFTPTTEQAQRFQQIASGEQRFAEMPELNIQKQIMESQRLARETEGAKTAQGRAELLRKTYGEGPQDYSRGMTMLDQILLSSPEAKQQLIGRVGEVGRVGLETAQQARQQAAQQLAGLKLSDEQLREGLRTGTTEAFGGLRTGLEERAGEYNVGMEQLAGALGGYLGGEGQLTAEQLGQLGDPGQEYLRSLAGEGTGYGTGYEDYLSQAREAGFLQKEGGIEAAIRPELLGQQIPGAEGQQFDDPELARLATGQEFARQKALESLTGRGQDFLSLYDPEELDRLQLGQYTGEQLGLLSGESAAPTSYEALRAERMRQVGQEFGAEKEAAAGQFAGQYYQDIGQHTGLGYAPGVGGRDPREAALSFLASEEAGFDPAQEESLYGRYTPDAPAPTPYNVSAFDLSKLQGLSGYDPSQFQVDTGIGSPGGIDQFKQQQMTDLEARRRALYEAQAGRLGGAFGTLPEGEE